MRLLVGSLTNFFQKSILNFLMCDYIVLDVTQSSLCFCYDQLGFDIASRFQYCGIIIEIIFYINVNNN